MNQEERRIVLLGKTGVGKSATGNTILRKNDVFTSKKSVDSVTEHSEYVGTRVGEKFIHVVDTPGFFDTKLPQDQLAEQLGRSVYFSRPGVHAFILVFKFAPFTEQEEEMITRLQKVFGEQVTDHMIIVFTDAEGVGEEEIKKSTNEHLRRVLDQCGGRFHIFNNAEPQNRQQVTELLQKIDRMVQQKRENQIFTNAELNNIQQDTNPPQNIDSVVEKNRGAELNNRQQDTKPLQKIDGMVEKNRGAELNNRQQDTKPLQKIDGMVEQNRGAELNNRQQDTKPLQKIDGMVEKNRGAELNNRQQDTKPLQKIDITVQRNKRFFTNKMYEEAQSSTWEEFWEKNKSFFHIGAGVLAAVAVVGYVVLTTDVKPVQGLMSMWMKGAIKVKSGELLTAGLVRTSAAVGLAAAFGINRSRKF